MYNKIEFSSVMLNAGFSIYLFELKVKNEKYFYVGMTGDNFYPSARSAIHRLSGHFEKSISSTQNQVNTALKNIRGKGEKIIMHHWSISGFVKWDKTLKNFNNAKINNFDLDEKEKYDSYKKRQKEVLLFEKHLISSLNKEIGDNCLNKTSSKIDDEYIVPNEFKEIDKEIKAIYNSEN